MKIQLVRNNHDKHMIEIRCGMFVIAAVPIECFNLDDCGILEALHSMDARGESEVRATLNLE